MDDRAGETIAQLMDHVLGWLLRLPSDAALIILALATSLLLAVVRLWTTDQDVLRRLADDKRLLRVLARQARADGDRSQARRHRENLAWLTWQTLGRRLKGECLTLAVSLLPLVLIGTWCFYRLEYHPPRAGQPLVLTLATPTTEIDSLVHLVPQAGVHPASSWVQSITRANDPDGPPRGIAGWLLTFAEQPSAYPLTIRIGQQTLVHPVLVGQARYLPPELDHRGSRTHLALEPVRLFGRVPGIPALALPPWAVGYLILAVLGTLLIKRGLRIH
jgi:hypothetical protein